MYIMEVRDNYMSLAEARQDGTAVVSGICVSIKQKETG